MVREANTKQAASEKQLKEARGKVRLRGLDGVVGMGWGSPAGRWVTWSCEVLAHYHRPCNCPSTPVRTPGHGFSSQPVPWDLNAQRVPCSVAPTACLPHGLRLPSFE